MPVEAGHIQLTEYSKEVIPKLNYMMEDLFCRYGVSIPYYILDFSFPDYQLKPEWPKPYTPEWLALYKPGMPLWPEHLWPNIPGWQLPEMKLPKWPDIQWPVLPEMAWPEWPAWPEWELPEWEWLKFYYPEWPEWDWPNWESPESRRIRRRRQREKLLAELQKTKKRIPVGITPRKPPIDLTNWYDENGFNFNVDQGEFGYDLPKLNELLGLLFDEADLPRITLPDLSPQSIAILNDEITAMYEAVEVGPVDYEFNSQTKDGYLEKFALSKEDEGGSWNECWTNMKAATPDVYTTGNVYGPLLAGYYSLIGGYDRWRSWSDRAYLSFDTSSLVGKTITAATIKIYITLIAALDDYETTRTINVYSLAWDTLGVSDWDGGSLITTYEETDLSVGSWHTITISDTSIINKTGETQFKIACKADIDNTTLTDPKDLGHDKHRGGAGHVWSSGNATNNKALLTVTAT